MSRSIPDVARLTLERPSAAKRANLIESCSDLRRSGMPEGVVETKPARALPKSRFIIVPKGQFCLAGGLSILLVMFFSKGFKLNITGSCNKSC